jgi:hypothetical protein
VSIYVGQKDVENRLSARVVVRLCDDNDTGTASSDIVEELIASAESRVEGACRDVYPLSSLRAQQPGEIKRLVLDGVVALAAMRFPRAMGREWQPLMENWKADLKALRRGEVALDCDGLPEPAANKGGEVLPASTDEAAEMPEPVFLNGTGDF